MIHIADHEHATEAVNKFSVLCGHKREDNHFYIHSSSGKTLRSVNCQECIKIWREDHGSPDEEQHPFQTVYDYVSMEEKEWVVAYGFKEEPNDTLIATLDEILSDHELLEKFKQGLDMMIKQEKNE